MAPHHHPIERSVSRICTIPEPARPARTNVLAATQLQPDPLSDQGGPGLHCCARRRRASTADTGSEAARRRRRALRRALVAA